jgi:hypothetical protein
VTCKELDSLNVSSKRYEAFSEPLLPTPPLGSQKMHFCAQKKNQIFFVDDIDDIDFIDFIDFIDKKVW